MLFLQLTKTTFIVLFFKHYFLLSLISAVIVVVFTLPFDHLNIWRVHKIELQTNYTYSEMKE